MQHNTFITILLYIWSHVTFHYALSFFPLDATCAIYRRNVLDEIVESGTEMGEDLSSSALQWFSLNL